MEAEIEKQDDWFVGFACACAVLAKLNGAEAAQEVVEEAGFDKETLEVHGAEEGDLEEIWPEG